MSHTIDVTSNMPSGMYPVTTHYHPNVYPGSMVDDNCSSILLSPSPPPVPKFTVPPHLNGGAMKSRPNAAASMSRLDERVLVNNCSVGPANLKAHTLEIFDSTSGREDWTEEGEEEMRRNAGQDNTSTGSTRMFPSIATTSEASTAAATDEDMLTQRGSSSLLGRLSRDCMSSLDLIVTIFLALVSISTPILMVILPKVLFPDLPNLTCHLPLCHTSLIFMATKLLLISAASLVLFCRRKTYSFPRVLLFKLILVILLFLIIFAFWLFYVLRFLLVLSQQKSSQSNNNGFIPVPSNTNSKPAVIDYEIIVTFASSVTDILIFIHYLSVIVLEIRHLDTKFYIKVVRSPDGHSKFYQMGNMSIQEAAVRVLQQYVIDFPMYTAPSSSRRNQEDPAIGLLTTTSMDGMHPINTRSGRRSSGGSTPVINQTRSRSRSRSPDVIGRSVAGGSDSARRGPFDSLRDHKRYTSLREKMYREMELEKRIKKRRLRLLASTEEAFQGLKKTEVFENEKTERIETPDSDKKRLLSGQEASQHLLAQLTRPLSKYLRVLASSYPLAGRTRIMQHLERSLQFGLSAKAFLEGVLPVTPRVMDLTVTDSTSTELHRSLHPHRQLWSVICDRLLSGGLSNNLTFVLKRGKVTLFCVVQSSPFFCLSEDDNGLAYREAHQKFVIKFNSETSV